MLDLISTLEPIFDSVKAKAISMAHAGVKIPGYEASFSNPRRIWTDDDQAAATLASLGLKGKERYTEPKVLSPAQAEDALRKKGKWPKKPRGTAAADFADPFTTAGVLSYTDSKPAIRKASEASPDA
jgi:hypothetical protein